MGPDQISCPWQTKRIVGRIIPAVVTTTAAVAGLVGLELYKVVGGPRPRHAFRHSYLHLAENYFSRWVPKAPDIQEVSPGHPTCTRPEFCLHLPKQALFQLQALVGPTLGESSRLPSAAFLLHSQAGTCQTQEAAVSHPQPPTLRVWGSCSFNSLVEPDIHPPPSSPSLRGRGGLGPKP